MDMRCTAQDPQDAAASCDPTPDIAATLNEWLGGDAAVPSLLERRYPHVVRRIEALWGSDRIHSFLDALTPGDDAPCQGFPPEVEAQIRSFRSAYRARFPQPAEPEATVLGATPAAVPPCDPPGEIGLDPDYDAWKGERRLRGWEVRSIF